jgi:4-amino-4-deoxy-L-arabinose transferase-like glycosyltransferase
MPSLRESNRPLVNRPGIYLLLILGLAAALRIYGLNWSLPHTYEEATPLRVAISMWGWQGNGPTNLNPQFFNYPSLTFYIHFVAQGLVFLFLRFTGEIKSVTDWYVLYLTNPTHQYIGARLVSVCFGVGTVFFTYKIARLVTTSRAALLAALLLATSPFHIARSQMIEVDIPLTFFVAMALYGVTQVIRLGRRRDYALSGIAIGLAASSKYTGLLLMIPFVAAHALAVTTVPERSARWKMAAGAVLLAIVAFAATSPYVVADWQRFWADLSVEREHMELGHFGVSGSAWAFYGHALTERLLGVLGVTMATIGAFHMCVKRPARPAIALIIFCLAYGCAIAMWSTKADRYLLPVLPPLLALVAGGVIATTDFTRRVLDRAQGASIAATLLGIALLTWNLGGIREYRVAIQHDTRTDAQEWIEANLPPGAFIVTEGYGPDLLDPATLIQLDPHIRTRVLERWRERPVFAVVALPMYQTRPERSAPFYNLTLYPEADYFITSSSVRNRYEYEPDRFRAQSDFYRQLNHNCRTLKEFLPLQDDGIYLTVYETRQHDRPFGKRDEVTPPPQLQLSPEHATNRESGFYFTMGTNYEYFRHFTEAASSYQFAIQYGTANPELFFQCVLGYTRCLLALGRANDAIQTLDQIAREIGDQRLKRLLAQLQGQIEDAAHKR